MKRPAFQFYPADHRKDVELGACGYVARGIWFEMLCVMHECRPYGHLVRDGRALPDESAATLLRVPVNVYRKAVRELEENGVFSRTSEGIIYSRRMIRDERLREVRAASGRLGGNPKLLNQEVNHQVNPEVETVSEQKPTPSASTAFASSSSSSDAVEQTPTASEQATDGDIKGRVDRTDGKTANPSEDWSRRQWIEASAMTFNMTRRTGESDDAWADRVHSEANRRRVRSAATGLARAKAALR